ncbi:SDR family oxidoreductase [Neptunomonas antarctica]|uniref:Nucleoside-diphosphate-sugar epimerase n=1 Tax=Neptunomonas antarctica TaxID=619304 RepID=A0A1N7IYG1_9GAMM|nr:SDR family oxidoreductase [Neptunomonas antarctica]SIS42120.1 Nucleoside-diphosphate-sugar epimerase [Neptunomonas antarctica]
MSKLRILIAGCGDVGSALGIKLTEQGHYVYGLRRTINQLPDCIHAISADIADKGTLSDLPDTDILIYCAAATGRSENAYRQAYIDGLENIYTALPHPPKHFFFTSSTSVYGQHQHEWVDEQSPTEATQPSGQIMRQAELAVLAKGNSTVVRFSGIYGPGRNHLINTVRAGTIAPENPLHYSNRIHRDDCAGVLAHLIQKLSKGSVIESLYLASDPNPTPIHEITAWLAEQSDTEITQETPIRRGGSKRCNSQRLQQSGYEFLYPDYKAGFQAGIITWKDAE